MGKWREIAKTLAIAPPTQIPTKPLMAVNGSEVSSANQKNTFFEESVFLPVLELPQPLQYLIRAAGSGLLPQGAVKLRSGLTTDLNWYVASWACAYLAGDRTHALERLNEALVAWNGKTWP